MSKLYVGKSDNLLSVIERAKSDSVIKIDPYYEVDCGDYQFVKPVSLICHYDDVGPDYVGPILRGRFEGLAPDCNFDGIIFEGINRDHTIWTPFDKTAFTRCLIRGMKDGQKRGIAANCRDLTIKSCRITGIRHDEEAQCIAGWNKSDDIQVEDCYLEASGINLIFGGTDSDSAETMPSNITITDCYFYKDPAWQNQSGAMVKNHLELKAASHVKVKNCVFENCWTSGQVGYSIVLSVRNQEGNATWSTVEHVEISDCIIRNVGAGIQILGMDYTHPSGRMQDVMIKNNHFTGVGAFPGSGIQILMSGGPCNFDLVSNIFEAAEGTIPNSFLSFDQPDRIWQGLNIWGNEFEEGYYGIKSDQGMGTSVLEAYAPGYVWWDNKVHRAVPENNIQYPAGTTVW